VIYYLLISDYHNYYTFDSFYDWSAK
jgi:hypothetical protein